jgi:hypothetical protein
MIRYFLDKGDKSEYFVFTFFDNQFSNSDNENEPVSGPRLGNFTPL